MGSDTEVERPGATSPFLQNGMVLRSGRKKEKRRKGRPTKVESHEGQYTASKEREQARREEELDRKNEEVGDPEVKATGERAESADRNSLSLRDSLRELSESELTAAGLRQIEVLKKIASTSPKMKGLYVGWIWKSVEMFTALSLVYNERLETYQSGEGKEVSGEMASMRNEMAALRTENALLNGQLRVLWE